MVHPGAAVSTADVHDGLATALRGTGAQVTEFRLDHRLSVASQWLRYRWRKAKLPPEKHPTFAEAAFQASWEAVGWALYHDVDAVLVVSAMYFHPDALVMLRRAGIRLGILLTESPYDIEQEARVAALADVVWTNERSSVRTLREANPNTHYLPHAYDPGRHTPLAVVDATVPVHDVLFVGTGFKERIEWLEAVDWERLGVDLGLYGTWDLLGSRHRLRKYVRGQTVPNRAAVSMYRAAKINLNLFRLSKGYGRDVPRIEYAESLGPRLYELAAAGCFQVSDHRAEVREVFGDAVPTVRTPDALAQAVERYLHDPEERARLAFRARQAVAPHTFAARAAQVLAQLAPEAEQALARGA